MKSIIYVMKFWYLVLILVTLSCSCLSSRSPASKVTLPDKELEEVVVRGVYAPGGQRAVEALKKLLLEEEELKSGEPVTKALKDKYKNYLKEYFTNSGLRYCYYKKTDKEPVSDHDLRVRFYDKNGEMLAEDFLRLESPDTGDFSYRVIAYLPYQDGGHEFRIVRLEGTKEVVIESLRFESHSNLIRFTHPDTQRNRVSGEIVFDTRDNCHVTSGSR